MKNWSRLPLNFAQAIGPLIFFYVLKKTRPARKFGWLDLLHLIPLLLEQGAFTLQIKESIKTGAATYNTLAFKQWNPVVQILAIVSVIIYILLSGRLINNFHRQLMPYVSRRSRYVLKWLYHLLTGLGIASMLSLPFIVVNYFYDEPGISVYHPFYLLSAILMIWISVTALLKKEVEVPAPVPQIAKPSPSADLMQKATWLKRTIETGRLYEDAELTLNSLAEKLNIHHHELSRIVNTALGKNFNDFVNEYRIREVGRKIKDPAFDHITLLGIAFESGFNSKSTFNRTFKEMTGKSPAEYKNSLKKEFPNYHLRRYAYTPAVISFHETVPKWSHQKLNRNYMFKNHFKTAWRNIRYNKLFATLNIAGLAIGVCVCITLFACASYELSFDRMYKHSKNIYRVNLQSGAQFDYKVWAQLPGIAGPTFLKDIPQVKAMTRLLKYSFGAVASLKAGEKNFSEKGLYMADTAILKIFDFSFTEGNARTAFNQPFSVIISESAKQRLFGKVAAIGKVISVDNASPSQSIPGDIESGKTIKRLENDKDGYPVLTCKTDGSIIKTMQLKLLAGTSIPRMLTADDTNCYLLINDAVRKYLGYKTPQEAIGRYATTEMHHRAIILGVLKDFNYQSLKTEIGGYLYYTTNKHSEPLNTLLIRYNTRDLPRFMEQVQATFKKDMPSSSFDYEFLDTHIQNLYASEKYTASTATVFSLLAIFVACLGLFGLAASIAERRTKEIGIRKVLGASVPGIAKLLTGDFLKLVLISIVIASPVAWFMMNKWLMAFSYRINVSVWAFVISGVLAIVFALITISSHAIKSATANPVKSLRSE